MASSLSWLSQLKSVQLKTLAIAVGIKSGGTKPILIKGLETHLPISVFPQQGARVTATSTTTRNQNEGPNILSIDMGIKNLAYCRLKLPPQTSDTIKSLKPTITDWARVDITKFATNPEGQDEDVSKVKAAFEPDVYAAHAYTLLSDIFQSASPTHVLIERQRFRSMGGSAVQEWTLRVNMFEAMLYAVLETLKREGSWEGKVIGISPARVTNLWLGFSAVRREDEGLEGGGKGSETRLSGIKTKKFKTQLVGNWLHEKEKFNLTAKIAGMRSRDFGVVGKRTSKSKVGKLDDLADCLLQGMAWLKWEENRRLIWEKGKDAIVEVEG